MEELEQCHVSLNPESISLTVWKHWLTLPLESCCRVENHQASNCLWRSIACLLAFTFSFPRCGSAESSSSVLGSRGREADFGTFSPCGKSACCCFPLRFLPGMVASGGAAGPSAAAVGSRHAEPGWHRRQWRPQSVAELWAAGGWVLVSWHSRQAELALPCSSPSETNPARLLRAHPQSPRKRPTGLPVAAGVPGPPALPRCPWRAGRP